MIVPQYWAEASRQERQHGRLVSVRRFGWSDTGDEEAQAHAEARAQEALERLGRGEPLIRREPKVAYNGAEGVPIREEIVGRHGSAIVTRNLYGARCLNTPDVLFADVDFPSSPPGWMLPPLVLLIAAILSPWLLLRLWPLPVGLAVLALPLGVAVLALIRSLIFRARGGGEGWARRRIDRFLDASPDWHLRLYRTPAGFRVMALQRTFDPEEAAVGEFFAALGTDPVYVRMCRNQRCFRARVSPKPWRIGIASHLRPRPGVWPVRPEMLPLRAQWIEAYERIASDYAACRFVEALGSRTLHPSAKAVLAAHDELCQATRNLPIA